MKTKHWILYSLLGIAMVLTTSCTKDHDLYVPKDDQKLSELNIPADFDWLTTKSVEYSIVSPVATTISVYLDQICSQDQLIATIPVSQEVSSFKLDIPKGSHAIYIQYPTKEGLRVMTVNIDNMATRADDAVIKLPEATEDYQTKQTYNYYCPSYEQMGTVMFEDNWPGLGDYDFNDFVIHYNITTIKNKTGDKEDDFNSDGITVTVQFRAIGGVLPYRLCLQLDKMPAKYIIKDNIEPIHANDDIKMVFLNEGDDTPAIFAFEGTNTLKQKTGGVYYNTEIDNVVKASELVTISYKLKVNSFNNPDKANALINSGYSETHNFFLQNTSNKREIHLRGYLPSKYYTQYDADAQSSNQAMKDGITYCTADNFVWGIKIYGPSFHTRENTDILEAFPEFKNFIQAGINPSWYKITKSDKVISL